MIWSSLRLLSVLLLALLVLGSGTSTACDPDAARNRWNWLADTRWYVPAENLLDDGNDSFQKFTHLGQHADNQRLSLIGRSVH
jgi:hypothetical protein